MRCLIFIAVILLSVTALADGSLFRRRVMLRQRQPQPVAAPTLLVRTPHLDDGYWDWVYPDDGLYRYPMFFWTWNGSKNNDARPTKVNGPFNMVERTWTAEGGQMPTDKPPPFMEHRPGYGYNPKTKAWEKMQPVPGTVPWNL